MIQKVKAMTTTTITVERDQHKHILLEKPGNYVVELTQPGAQATIGGAFRTSKRDDVCVSVVVHHRAPHTRAQTTLKGVARDQSWLKFVGRIIIDEQCGDTSSFLTERILLLSDQAKAETVPDLEILSDDVKCSHAASISRIPEEHIFYLQSRGISRPVAEEMIVAGFLNVPNSA